MEQSISSAFEWNQKQTILHRLGPLNMLDPRLLILNIASEIFLSVGEVRATESVG